MPLPRNPLATVENALETLDRHLSLRVVNGPSTHTPILADDLENTAVPPALGRYIVGVAAGAIGDDVQLSEQLLAREADSRAEVREHVLRLVGSDNVFNTTQRRRFRDRVRNPWIAEAIAHVLLTLRHRRITPCLEGDVYALKQPHADPRRQGLDLIGIYVAEDLPAVAIGEAKASRRYGARRLNDAAGFFSGIDAGRRGVEIRTEVSALKYVLPDDLRIHVADGFWRDRCCYLPVIVHSEPMNELEDHDGLAALRPPSNSRRLLALRLGNFHAFFDAVADGIRIALDEVVGDV